MISQILSGSELARKRLQAITEKIRALHGGLTLATLQVGESKAIELYAKHLKGLFDQAGIHLECHALEVGTPEREVIRKILGLNSSPGVTGIMIFSPLPKTLDAANILDALDTRKDVEGRTFLKSHRGVFSPTANAVMALIEASGRRLNGLKAVVVGHSDIVGKPTAVLLMDKMATVTVCHVETRDLEGCVRDADIVVAAVGKPCLIQGDWIRPGAVVIDVGENVVEGRIVGDVEFEVARKHAAFISPVPGGVGPLTNVMLIENLFRLHELECRRNGNH